MLSKTNVNLLNAMVLDYVRPLALEHFFFKREERFSNFCLQEIHGHLITYMGNELSSMYDDRKSSWVKYSAGKREVAQFHTG